MGACAEARDEALNIHVKWNSMGSGYEESVPEAEDAVIRYWLNSSDKVPVYVNPAKDFFFIGGADEWCLSKYATKPWLRVNNDSLNFRDDSFFDKYYSKYLSKYLTTIDVNDVVFEQVAHLAVGFLNLCKSSVLDLEEFFWDLTKFNGLKDLTIALPVFKGGNIMPHGDGYFIEAKTETSGKISGLLQRYVTRLLDEHLG